MGKGAAKMAQWLGTPARFADFYNGSVFHGNRMIHPEELEPVKGETHKVEVDKDKKQQPVRNMIYDSLAYQEQIDSHWNLLSKEEKRKCSKKEFLSHYQIGEKLRPIITLVFYYCDEEWNENRELLDMLEMDEIEKCCPELAKYIQNYRINLIDITRMEDINVFHSDLHHVLGMLRDKGNKDLLNGYIKENPDYFNNIDKETALVIGELLDSDNILKAAEEIREGERMSMCKALEDLYNDGKLDKIIDLITKKLAKGKTIAEIADALEETEDTIERIIKEHNLLRK